MSSEYKTFLSLQYPFKTVEYRNWALRGGSYAGDTWHWEFSLYVVELTPKKFKNTYVISSDLAEIQLFHIDTENKTVWISFTHGSYSYSLKITSMYDNVVNGLINSINPKYRSIVTKE